MKKDRCFEAMWQDICNMLIAFNSYISHVNTEFQKNCAWWRSGCGNGPEPGEFRQENTTENEKLRLDLENSLKMLWKFSKKIVSMCWFVQFTHFTLEIEGEVQRCSQIMCLLSIPSFQYKAHRMDGPPRLAHHICLISLICLVIRIKDHKSENKTTKLYYTAIPLAACVQMYPVTGPLHKQWFKGVHGHLSMTSTNLCTGSATTCVTCDFDWTDWNEAREGGSTQRACPKICRQVLWWSGKWMTLPWMKRHGIQT